MSIKDLHIHSVRTILSTRITLNPRCNIFYGVNGSGKTSLLEAIYLLSTGHSFRTREISPLVNHEADSLAVFARTFNDESISIQKSIHGPTRVRLNQQPCYNSSELAFFLPVQVIYQDVFQIMDAGPSVRRALLDWGLFHVEQSYHSTWKRYYKVLKHRNALLRQKAAISHFSPWDQQLVDLADALNQAREHYFMSWADKFQWFLSKLTDVSCTVRYYKGWDRKGSGQSLAEILNEQMKSDRERQYTYAGPHQADIYFELASKKAKPLLSRGQQKMVLIALKLGQASLVPKTCIYLFDDIGSELDANHLTRLLDCIDKTPGQFFITTMDDQILALTSRLASKAFALDQGVFTALQ